MEVYIQKEGAKKPVGGGIGKEALGRIQALEAELQSIKSELARSAAALEALKASKATAGAYGLVKISESAAVTGTDAGLVLPAKEKNANMPGTLAYLAGQNKSAIDAINYTMFRMAEYRKFSEIPATDYLFGFYIVNYSGVDNDAPIKTNGAHWWNVIQFGIRNRLTQVAFHAFSNRDKAYIRQKHDDYWYGWYELVGEEAK